MALGVRRAEDSPSQAAQGARGGDAVEGLHPANPSRAPIMAGLHEGLSDAKSRPGGIAPKQDTLMQTGQRRIGKPPASGASHLLSRNHLVGLGQARRRNA